MRVHLTCHLLLGGLCRPHKMECGQLCTGSWGSAVGKAEAEETASSHGGSNESSSSVWVVMCHGCDRRDGDSGLVAGWRRSQTGCGRQRQRNPAEGKEPCSSLENACQAERHGKCLSKITSLDGDLRPRPPFVQCQVLSTFLCFLPFFCPAADLITSELGSEKEDKRETPVKLPVKPEP